MSDQEPIPPHEVLTEEPQANLEAYRQKPGLYKRVTQSIPLLVTVLVHVVLFLVAGALVVQEQILSKKTKFEAPPPKEAAAPQEHRLQVARKGGSSGGSSSPVSANRIYTTAEGALQLPDMPSLPSMGAGGFGGFSAGLGGIGLGQTGTMNTSIGSSGMGGRGFMSVSFLGMTSQEVRKLVFIVDVNKSTMREGKGGFEAFAVIREEIMRLIAGMPGAAEFNVIIFEGEDNQREIRANLFSDQLLPATTANKEAFMKWMAPVNSSLEKLGIGSAGSRRGWRPKDLPQGSGITDEFDPSTWVKAVHAALEMQPDTIFVITSSTGRPTIAIGETEWRRRLANYETSKTEYFRYLKQQGLTHEAVSKARSEAYAKGKREFDAANKAIVAKGRPPIILNHHTQVFDTAVQARLKREGFNITLDTTGWVDRSGNMVRHHPNHPNRISTAPWNDQNIHISRLQKALVPERAALNIFLFSGTATPSATDTKNLADTARKFGGSFEVLSNQRLKELKALAEKNK